MRTKPAVRDAAYRICAGALLGTLTEEEKKVLTRAIVIVLRDDRKSRTKTEKHIQMFIGIPFWTCLVFEAIDRIPNAQET